jgi:AcrR family transcriptional regulator
LPQAGDSGMKKRPDITDQTRQNLIEAFWSLYRQKRIEHISIKDITTRAGYNRSTFYEYFGDIYDVLNQLEEALLENLKEQVLSSLENGLNDDMIQNLADVYQAKGDYFGTLLSENGDPYFAQRMKAIMRSALSSALGLPEKDIRTAYIFEFGLSAIIGTLTHWYNHQKEIPSKEMVGLMSAMLARGILPEIQKYSNLTFNVSG